VQAPVRKVTLETDRWRMRPCACTRSRFPSLPAQTTLRPGSKPRRVVNHNRRCRAMTVPEKAAQTKSRDRSKENGPVGAVSGMQW